MSSRHRLHSRVRHRPPLGVEDDVGGVLCAGRRTRAMLGVTAVAGLDGSLPVTSGDDRTGEPWLNFLGEECVDVDSGSTDDITPSVTGDPGRTRASRAVEHASGAALAAVIVVHAAVHAWRTRGATSRAPCKSEHGEVGWRGADSSRPCRCGAGHVVDVKPSSAVA